MDIRAKIDRMVEIKRQQEQLKREWVDLEAFFLAQGGADLADTKRKTVSYVGDHAKVTATMAESFKVTWPAYLKQIFGEAYRDAVTEDINYKLSAPAKRMLTGLWTHNFTESTVADVI